MSVMNLLSNEYRVGRDIGLFILRLVFAFTLIYGHGFGKLSLIFSGHEIRFLDPIGIGPTLSFYLAAFAEAICTIFLIALMFSRFAAFIFSLNFVVIFSFHAFIAKDGFEILEPRLFYLFCFVALIFTGPGRISLDQLFFNKRKNSI
jgi:putative oxidoreductase